MTIFQKMLLVPALGLVLFTAFLLFGYQQHQNSSQQIETIHRSYIPILSLVNQNNLLFKELQTVFKDAVLAGEPDWLNYSSEIKTRIEQNLTLLETYPEFAEQPPFIHFQQNFPKYYLAAEQLALNSIEDPEFIVNAPELVTQVERYQTASMSAVSTMQDAFMLHVQQQVNDTHKSFNASLLTGGLIGISSLVVILLFSLFIAFNTRKQIFEVVTRMKQLALGETEFSQRLQHDSRDEVGYLIHWFNKLSDKLEASYRQIEQVSITDKLTQLNNRTRTDSYLPRALAQAQLHNQPFTVALLDIDKFKSINDNFGHLVGDQVLQTLAQVLRKHARDQVYLARWGGEEFIFVINELEPDEASKYLEHLRAMIEKEPFPEVGNVTASIGFTINTVGDEVQDMLSRADTALYQAKEEGRNRVVKG